MVIMKYLIPSFALLLCLSASSSGQTKSKTPAQGKTTAKTAKKAPQKPAIKKEETIVLNQPGHKAKTIVEIIDNNLYINGDLVTNLKDSKGNRRIVINNNGSNEQMLSKEGFDSMLSQFTSRRVMLGVYADDYGVDGGAEITGIMPNTPAQNAGLKQGDVIIRINEHDIKKSQQLIAAINENKAGDKISITYRRKGSTNTIDARLSEADPLSTMGIFKDPRKPGMEIDSVNSDIPASPFMFEDDPYVSTPKMGITAEEEQNGKGILVQDVNANSAAAEAGLRKGDIITKLDKAKVKTVEELLQQLHSVAMKKTVKVYYLRDGAEQATDMHLSRKENKKDM